MIDREFIASLICPQADQIFVSPDWKFETYEIMLFLTDKAIFFMHKRVEISFYYVMQESEWNIEFIYLDQLRHIHGHFRPN